MKNHAPESSDVLTRENKKSKLDSTLIESFASTKPEQQPYEENFNSRYSEPELILNVRNALRKRQDYKDFKSNASVHGLPFPTVILPNVFSAKFLKDVRSELETETFLHRSNDLYEFYQSDDLRLSKNLNVIRLRETIYSQKFVQMMSELTGIQLDSTPDLSAHQYLVDEDWTSEDGGCLDLFNTDDKGHPNQVTRSIIPKWNTMAFFELSPTSYHQVAEVVSSSKARLSISGWFHGPLNARLSCAKYDPPIPASSDVYDINNIVNQSYLTEKGIKDVVKVLRKEASIELQQFLQPNVYDRLVKSLNDACWDENPEGPPFVRRYHLIKLLRMNQSDHNTRELTETSQPFHQHIFSFFISTIFTNYLKKITHYDVTAISSEIRQFQRGDYTLIHDQAFDREGLDIVFYCIEEDWDCKWEGGTHYVGNGEELLTIWPKKNTLSIVVRDTGTMKFIKYVNSSARIARREMSFIFLDDNDDDDGEDYTDEEDADEQDE